MGAYEMGKSGESLTEEEADALLTALDKGYFAVPRQTPLAALADELGITDRETSRRLRRAMGTIFKHNREQFERQLNDGE